MRGGGQTVDDNRAGRMGGCPEPPASVGLCFNRPHLLKLPTWALQNSAALGPTKPIRLRGEWLQGSRWGKLVLQQRTCLPYVNSVITTTRY